MIPSLLLAAAAKLGYLVTGHDATGRELGVLVNTSGVERALVIAAPPGASRTPGLCAWALLDAGPAPRMAYRLTRAAAEALQWGQLADDGSLLHNGSTCFISADFDGVVDLVWRTLPSA